MDVPRLILDPRDATAAALAAKALSLYLRNAKLRGLPGFAETMDGDAPEAEALLDKIDDFRDFDPDDRPSPYVLSGDTCDWSLVELIITRVLKGSADADEKAKLEATERAFRDYGRWRDASRPVTPDPEEQRAAEREKADATDRARRVETIPARTGPAFTLHDVVMLGTVELFAPERSTGLEQEVLLRELPRIAEFDARYRAPGVTASMRRMFGYELMHAANALRRAGVLRDRPAEKRSTWE